MRITTDIADDVLHAAKARARCEHKTLGQVISALARHALNMPPAPLTLQSSQRSAAAHGLRPFPRRGNVVTNELINRLRDDE